MTTISTSNLEGELLDQALESVLSLPQVCHQVALQQRDQCVELKHQSDILAAKQVTEVEMFSNAPEFHQL